MLSLQLLFEKKECIYKIYETFCPQTNEKRLLCISKGIDSIYEDPKLYFVTAINNEIE